MAIGTRLFTWWHGRRVGQDHLGNLYYEDRRAREGERPRRWVMYAGEPEASNVPPEWHMWLHSTLGDPPTDVPVRPWQKPHMPNLTGTPLAYRPPGHDYEGGRRRIAKSEYDAWTPDS